MFPSVDECMSECLNFGKIILTGSNGKMILTGSPATIKKYGPNAQKSLQDFKSLQNKPTSS